MSKLQEKPSALKREHPALQKKKFSNFFSMFAVHFALLDPVPDTDPGNPIESGSNPDPDLQHCYVGVFYEPQNIRRLAP
jgi:hypothetical protein